MIEDQQPTIIELNMHKIAKANLWLTLIFSFLFVMLNNIIHQQFSFGFSIWHFFIFIFSYFALIVLHELFHLIGFVLFGRVSVKQLDYGINLKLGVAYATTTEPLKNSAMKKALLLPFWTTGVLPAIIGFFIGSNILVLLGAFLIAGAIGDFYMYKELRKFSKNALIKDDAELPRLYVYEI